MRNRRVLFSLPFLLTAILPACGSTGPATEPLDRICGQDSTAAGPLGVACRPPNLVGTSTTTSQLWSPANNAVLYPYRVDATLEWIYDSAASLPDNLTYNHRGTAQLTSLDPCITLTPAERSWEPGDVDLTGQMVINRADSVAPLRIFAAGAAAWMVEVTNSCLEESYSFNHGGSFLYVDTTFSSTFSSAGSFTIPNDRTYTYDFHASHQ